LVAVATTPPYCWYLLGQAADTIALWMQRLALGWLVWELTASTAWLGAISFLKFAPTMVLGLFGGVLADRFPRGHIVLAGQAVSVFKAVTVAVLIVTGDINLPILVVLTLMVGIAVGLSQAAGKAVVHELVPRDRVPSAIALNSVVFNVSQLVGPAVAGLILVFAGTVACFVAIAALFALNFAVFALILPRIANKPTGSSLRPIIDMLPAFAGGELGGGVDAVSLLTSAIGVGAIASGIYLATRKPGPGLLNLVMISMVVLGSAMLGFAAAPNLPIATVMATLIGAGMAVRAAGVQTLVQLSATEDLRGRVLSLYGLGLNTGASLGAIGVGALAEWIGLRWALASVAIASLLVLGFVLLRRREMEIALERKEKP
jgi:MFS family permease